MGAAHVGLVAVAAAFVLMLTAGCSAVPTHLDPVRGGSYDGGQVQFDGMYYDFRAANGIQHTKMWVPPGPEPVRGVLLHGNPGGYGDTRNQPRDGRLQEFAARHRFAIMGVTSFPGGEVYPHLAEVIVRSMDDWAELGFHPEIAHLPMIARGSSNAGVTAYSLAAYAPERMVCITPNVGPRYNPYPPPDEMLRVPALMHVGPEDPFFPDGVEATRELFDYARPKGALWAWDAEKGKGHEIAHIDDVDMKYYEQIIPMRLPKDAGPRGGPVRLVELPEESGWLADTDSWGSGLTYVAPFADYERDRDAAAWLPTADLAFLYRAVATHDNPLELVIRQLSRTENPNERGVLLQTQAGPLVEPGTRIRLECDASGMPDWEEITFYHGAEEIGRAERGQEPAVTFTVEPDHTVYALTALGRAADGAVRSATPVHFMVRDPEVSAALAAQRAAYDVVPPKAPRPALGSSAEGAAVRPHEAADHVLVAYGLSAEQESSFTSDGGLSPFWDAFGEGLSHVRLTVQDSLAGQSEDSETARPTRDVAMTVCAAHSRAGLYMLFVVEDDEWAAAHALDDAIDFHLARMSSQEIWAADPADVFVKPESWGLVLSGMQYQINLGNAERPAATINRNFPDPWDVHSVRDDFAAAAEKYGILVRHASPAAARRAVELFLPWRWVGNGGPMEEPAVGRRLGLALGYNDRDPSAQEAGRTDDLRWPNKTDVWLHAGQQGPDPSPWADLEIGPLLPQ
jgi:hypothetical protein